MSVRVREELLGVSSSQDGTTAGSSGGVSLGGDGRAFDVVHAGLDAALGRAEGAA